MLADVQMNYGVSSAHVTVVFLHGKSTADDHDVIK